MIRPRSLCLALILVASLPATGAEVRVRNRSEIRIRDPYVLPVAEDRTYYMYASITVPIGENTRRKGVGVYTSKDLQSWRGPIPVFHCPDDFWADQAVWAPEVHRYKGKYYLFVTFTSKDPLPTPPGRPKNVKRGTQILVADSPMGPFKPFANEPHTPEDWMSLDGTLWVEDGDPYMVFCHEWVQITTGTIELVRLTNDLSGVIGRPRTLFKATDAKWIKSFRNIGSENDGYVTDGPFLYRTKSGTLLMIWSSFGENNYAVGMAVSASGKIAGPWKQRDRLLFHEDGGHGMLFRTFDGRLVLSLHQPNTKNERAHFFELEDTGDSLRITREIGANP